eukprot:TRINITY_DN3633_c0_g1_i1.p1 TRINITY_DN3633_c0_g1~~TRINITY_DN3633_c0_g1_i1.p1  ORF type:complete len:141 (+),score=17.05 TRINITY_DN3633_c0_g1_i1:99-521(+)
MSLMDMWFISPSCSSFLIYPISVETCIISGKMYALREDFGKAEELFQEAVSLSPKSIDARIEMGHMQFKQQKFAEALSTYESVLNLDPSGCPCFHSRFYIDLNPLLCLHLLCFAQLTLANSAISNDVNVQNPYTLNLLIH